MDTRLLVLRSGLPRSFRKYSHTFFRSFPCIDIFHPPFFRVFLRLPPVRLPLRVSLRHTAPLRLTLAAARSVGRRGLITMSSRTTAPLPPRSLSLLLSSPLPLSGWTGHQRFVPHLMPPQLETATAMHRPSIQLQALNLPVALDSRHGLVHLLASSGLPPLKSRRHLSRLRRAGCSQRVRQLFRPLLVPRLFRTCHPITRLSIPSTSSSLAGVGHQTVRGR